MLLSAAALACFVLPLIEGRARGWPWWTLAMLAVSPMLALAFRRHEVRLARAGGDPLVAVEIFRRPGMLRGLGAILTLYLLSAFFLTFAIYLQDGLGFSPLASGLEIVPFSMGFLAGSSASASLGRWAGRAASSLGFLISAGGLLGLAGLVAFSAPPAPPAPVPLALVLGLVGFGMGTAIPTMVRVVVERVEPRHAGLVGGLVNSTLQVSAAIGVAALGGLFYAVVGSRIGARALADGFAATMLAVALCHLVGAVLAAGLSQARRRPASALALPAAQSRALPRRSTGIAGAGWQRRTAAATIAAHASPRRHRPAAARILLARRLGSDRPAGASPRSP